MLATRMDAPFPSNPALYGADPTPGIVAVEFDGGDRVRVFRRTPEEVIAETDRWRPFLFLESADLLPAPSDDVEILPLEGPWEYRTLALFPGWEVLEKAVRRLHRATGKSPRSVDGPFYWMADPVQQYLTWTGRTLYKGLRYEDVHRLQLDIETAVTPGFEFPNPEREGDRITLISLSDSTGWESSLRSDRLTEAEMIAELTRIVRERDPDVIEGHNLFNFDLPYLEARARRHGLTLGWGRNGAAVRSRPSQFSAAERIVAYTRFDVYGRQVIDTLFLVQLYDVSTRELPNFGLKAVARHLGLASEDRTYVARRDIGSIADTDMDTLVRYGLDDVRETREISRVLGRSHFHQAQMFPFTHQNTVVRGTATRIDALMVREYLRRRHAVPRPPPKRTFAGGYTEVFVTGVVGPVAQCDVRSLYPSILLTFRIRPAKDDLDVFLGLLDDLTRRRLEAKDRARAADAAEERTFYEALQSTYKVLINSFYGYLGFAQGHFADFDAAARVTREGRRLVQKVLDELRKRGAVPVEVDTDGVYFVPPPEVRGREEKFVREVSATLPDGIELELAGRYRAMFSYKAKNYVLLTEDGQLRIRGSGLRSRGLEKFQRVFMEEMFRALLEGRAAEIPAIKERFLEDLRAHRWTPEWFAKTETLHDSLEVYRKKRARNARNASAAYELALASGRPYRPGDQITYYVTGSSPKVRVFEAARLASEWDPSAPDENTAYYAAKLESLYRKFRSFWETPPTT
ncbi:DNA polymerase domain-containing protein [Deferrisoma camini]|uniref:DNA polymerase domain-containing protein n=1 Tax=Deferrisoma camini TaxID=1035120 RepID=UPI0004AF35FA|nr:DNA polymerase domain-containing protein [Deferrisoma camini]